MYISNVYVFMRVGIKLFNSQYRNSLNWSTAITLLRERDGIQSLFIGRVHQSPLIGFSFLGL